MEWIPTSSKYILCNSRVKSQKSQVTTESTSHSPLTESKPFQVHYASVEYIPETGDDSGVFLEYTSQPQPKTAGVLLLGTAGQIPAHSTTFFETACEIEEPRDIHPFAFRVHTHALG